MHCQHASRRCKPQAVVTEAQPESATCTPPQENRQLLSKQDRWSMAASRQFLLTAAQLFVWILILEEASLYPKLFSKSCTSDDQYPGTQTTAAVRWNSVSVRRF